MENKICTLLLALGLPILLYANNPSQQELLNKAAGKVNSFFGSFKTISIEKNGFKVSKLRDELEEKYFEAKTEQHAPNEFNYLGYNNDFKNDIAILTYIVEFQKMFNDTRFQNCTFDFDVLTNQSNLVKHRAEFTKNETPIEFARIVVRKTYKKGYTVLKVTGSLRFFATESGTGSRLLKTSAFLSPICMVL